MLETVRKREGGNDGVVAFEGIGEVGYGEVAVDWLDRDQGMVCAWWRRGGVGSVQDGYVVLSLEEGGEELAAQVAVGAHEDDLERHNGV